jgi:hypothetical protein
MGRGGGGRDLFARRVAQACQGGASEAADEGRQVHGRGLSSMTELKEALKELHQVYARDVKRAAEMEQKRSPPPAPPAPASSLLALALVAACTSAMPSENATRRRDAAAAAAAP